MTPPLAALPEPLFVLERISDAPRTVVCPHCGSDDTERIAEFGSTPCKALFRRRACREPFDHFKPL